MINKYKKQAGFGVLAMLLIVIAMMSAIAYFTLSGGDTTNVINNSNITNRIVSQASIIRSRILACGIEYPQGNNGSGFRAQYPAATTAVDIALLTCPGANNANLWTLLDGLSSPPVLAGFSNWSYVNDGTSLRITIQPTNTDGKNAMPNVVSSLGANQASYTAGVLTWTLVN